VLAAAFLAEAGRGPETRDMCRKVLEMDPKFSAVTFVRFQGLGNRHHREALKAALRKAGLPE